MPTCSQPNLDSLLEEQGTKYGHSELAAGNCKEPQLLTA